ncbi:unnamed protein product, partial [Prorocentrum cordatum]
SGVPRNFYTPSSPLSALHAAPIHTDACKLYSTREATENSGGEDDEKDEEEQEEEEEEEVQMPPGSPGGLRSALRPPAATLLGPRLEGGPGCPPGPLETRNGAAAGRATVLPQRPLRGPGPGP